MMYKYLGTQTIVITLYRYGTKFERNMRFTLNQKEISVCVYLHALMYQSPQQYRMYDNESEINCLQKKFQPFKYVG